MEEEKTPGKNEDDPQKLGKGPAQPKKEQIQGLIQYSVEGDQLVVSKTTVSIKNKIYFRAIKEKRQRLIFVCDLSTEDMLQEASKFIDTALIGI